MSKDSKVEIKSREYIIRSLIEIIDSYEELVREDTYAHSHYSDNNDKLHEVGEAIRQRDIHRLKEEVEEERVVEKDAVVEILLYKAVKLNTDYGIVVESIYKI